jgi:hypothetical protein
MKKILLLLILVTTSVFTYAQTCTISGSGTKNWSTATCIEAGVTTANATAIIVPSGVNLTFTTNPAKTATLTVQSGGTLTNNKANAVWNGDVTINSGASFVLNQIMDMGSSAGCGYDLTLLGSMTLSGSGGSDLLSICGKKIAQSGGGCNSCGGTNSGTCALTSQPYCEPSGGFVGPLGYSETGYNASLPVDIAYFVADVNSVNDDEYTVALEWATSMEEDFSHFEVERSADGREFQTIGTLEGAGKNLSDVTTKYQLTDRAPLLGFSYYRLKAIDIDGSYDYSDLQVVKLEGTRTVIAYPNPATSDQLNFMSNFTPSENDVVVLRDSRGQEILSSEVTMNKFSLVPTRNLSKGLYLLEYKGANWSGVIKVFVKD